MKKYNRTLTAAAPTVTMERAPEADARRSSLLALGEYLKTVPGTVTVGESDNVLSVHYTRNATHGLAYPFSDYCDMTFAYNAVTNVMTSKGTAFGQAVEFPEDNDPGLFLLQSMEQSTKVLTVVRDFLSRCMKICERYGGNNLDNFVFQLGRQLRNTGSFARTTPPDAPPGYVFKATEATFYSWFASSSMGVGVIKFTPTANVGGYTISMPTFTNLMQALNSHVDEHRKFIEEAISATNPMPVA